ncbi:hypothetical protein BU17DRAFT_53279 [Hysterangium stoloniferum]|nr:hypothetical protein BU17DRAFT_53279 [Hysterangium stoloniferum]
MPYLTEDSLSNFTLVPATAAQILVSRKRQSLHWARGMTEKEFISRENKLEVLEHSEDGKLRAWALVPRDDPETIDHPCSCETFRRKVLVSSASNALEEAVGYGIATVFCGPEYRKRGFTSHMMRLLHYILAPPGSLGVFPEQWGAPPACEGLGDARCSVLYSDVGNFYSRCGPAPLTTGWEIRSPVGTTWTPEHVTGLEESAEEFEFLSEEECRLLWEDDATYIAEQLSKLPSSSPTRFTFLPSQGVAAFLISRALAEEPLLPKVSMDRWGVRLIQTGGPPPAYATWTLDMELTKPPVIVVTRLRATPESFPSLLRGLLAEALRINAKAIEVWNLDTGLADVAANMGGKTAARTQDHLSAVAWYGSESQHEVEWAFNEKYDYFIGLFMDVKLIILR